MPNNDVNELNTTTKHGHKLHAVVNPETSGIDITLETDSEQILIAAIEDDTDLRLLDYSDLTNDSPVHSSTINALSQSEINKFNQHFLINMEISNITQLGTATFDNTDELCLGNVPQYDVEEEFLDDATVIYQIKPKNNMDPFNTKYNNIPNLIAGIHQALATLDQPE